MRKNFILFFSVFSCFLCRAQMPSTEVRAVWLTTNWNLDWPSPNLGIEGQKEELQSILDELQSLHFNTVFFQTRVRGDVFYNSDIEPRSPYAKPGFDYLQYAIDECHKRGIECHAWIVMFPLGTKKQVAAHGRQSVVSKHRNLCKLHNNEWYLDPGNPATRTYLLDIVKEVVNGYDIDGVHFDYIRYPENATKFQDKDTYQKYGQGFSLADWRRNNINTLVRDIYKEVKAVKPWVQVSSSPIGKYKNLDYNNGGWTAYESVYQDAGYWLQAGIHDAVYPMMYYKGDDFGLYLADWIRHANNRFVVSGLGAYQMLTTEKNWNLHDITTEIDKTREQTAHGQAYFRAGNITGNVKGIASSLKSYYRYQAKLPAMNWLDSVAPNSPIQLEVYRKPNGNLYLSWLPFDQGEKQTYTVYYSADEDVDVNNPQNILATGVADNHIELEISNGEFGFYYSVSASDRCHNESVPCFPAYFVHLLVNK